MGRKSSNSDNYKAKEKKNQSIKISIINIIKQQRREEKPRCCCFYCWYCHCYYFLFVFSFCAALVHPTRRQRERQSEKNKNEKNIFWKNSEIVSFRRKDINILSVTHRNKGTNTTTTTDQILSL